MNVNREIARATYAFLSELPPFNTWNLPEADDVKFLVFRDKSMYAYYNRRRRRHIIGINQNIKTLHLLMHVMAHEMIHLYQGTTGMETRAQHNAAFHALAKRVTKEHGFDPMELI